VWIYGPGPRGEFVAGAQAPTLTSQRGKLRADMGQQLRVLGVRYAMVRLAEFYGPSVNSWTTRVFRAGLSNRRSLWPGPLDVAIELVNMPLDHRQQETRRIAVNAARLRTCLQTLVAIGPHG
jgi:hypothetical protein